RALWPAPTMTTSAREGMRSDSNDMRREYPENRGKARRSPGFRAAGRDLIRSSPSCAEVCTMASGNGAATEVSAEDFRAAFERVRPLVEKEWPAIDGAALEATAGDLDKVVDLVARETEKARDAVKQQLFALHAKATKKRFDRLEAIVDKLEKRTRDIAE